MRNTTLIIGLLFMASTGLAAVGTPVVVEMPMAENWAAMPDSESVTVIWFSDAGALLAVQPEGLDLLRSHDIAFELLTEWKADRDYYIFSSRSGDLTGKWAGLKLKSGHFLVDVPAGTILEADRNLGYQRIRMSQRPISALTPRVYTGYASRDYNPLIQTFVDQVDSNYLEELLDQMVAFVTRYSYASQCTTAVNWAVDEFESWGYDVELDPHTSGMAPNLIAWKHGSVNPDRIWVVGGHFDSTSQTPSTLAPGADDNGTGSALTMCCANILKDLQFSDTIIYALWTGEEQGLYGSDSWATWAAGQNLDIQGYYNFDMIGWVEPAPEDLDVLVNNASLSFGQDFVDTADMYTSLLHNLEVANVSASDHYSFWQQGYVSFCAIEDYWPVYPYYHTTQDTVDKIDFPFFTEVTKAMVANICTAAQLAESMTFGQSSINCNGQIELTVIDSDATGSIIVSVHSDTETTPENIMLAEYSAHVFTGTVQLTDDPPTAGDARVSVTHGDSVVAEYAGVPNNAVADVDCIAPAISGVTVSALTSTSVTIGFNTGESTTAIVRYGESVPDQAVPGSGSGVSHSITIDQLNDCTVYYFEIEAADSAGNTTVDDNGGAFYFFVTLERVVMLDANMDTNPGWTYQNQWAWGQPTGQGGEYGNPDPTGGYTGTNVVGYNLSGDYPNSMSSTQWATTQAVNCSGATAVILSFRAWLGVEQSIYDEAYIAVSNNNGTSWTTIWENSDTLEGGTWELWEFDISAQAAGYSQVMIRWGIGPTDSGWRYCGWNIDDVNVFFEQPCIINTPTPAPTATPEDCLHTGDVNFSGDITAGDAQTAFQIAIGTFSPTYPEECAADCNGDGTVTAGDAQGIFLAALGAGSCQDPI